MTTFTMTEREVLFVLLGRLDGLAGTVRYELPDCLRAEIRECADHLRRVLGEDGPPPPTSLP